MTSKNLRKRVRKGFETGPSTGSPTAATERPTFAARRSVRWSLFITFIVVFAATFGLGGFAVWPMQQARVAVAARNYRAAESWLAWADRLRGDRATLELLRARIARQRGDTAAMAIQLERATSSGVAAELVTREGWLAAAQTGRLREVEPELKAWLADPGEEGAAICDAYCNGLTAQGRLEEAQWLLDAWQTGFPDDPEPHVKRGRIAEHALAYEGAEREYRQALEKRPGYPPALYALARLLIEQKRSAEALPRFRACASEEPITAFAAELGVVMCLRTLGQNEEARALAERLVDVPQATRQAAFALVGFPLEGDPAALERGRLAAAERDVVTAERWLRQAVERDPYNLDARFAWATALRSLGKQEEAAAEFEQVSLVRKELAKTEAFRTRLMQQPDDVESRYQIGLVYLRYQSPRLGLYWLQTALAYDPHHQPTHQALAEYYEAHQAEQPSYRNLAQHHREQAAAVSQPMPAASQTPPTAVPTSSESISPP